jgi:hypothetical protein
MTELPKAVWQGSFNVWGIELKCYVLDTGQRIIDAESMDRFIEALTSGDHEPDINDELATFLRWQKEDPTR